MNPRNDMLPWVSLQHAAFFLRHELDARLRESVGVSFMERDLLGHMARSGDDWKMKDFAVALCVSKTAVTKLVNRLEAGGLVERVPSPVDRRVTQLRLTNRGDETLRESRPVIGSFVRTQFADVLSSDELETLGKALIKVLKLHDRWEGQERYLSEGAGPASAP